MITRKKLGAASTRMQAPPDWASGWMRRTQHRLNISSLLQRCYVPSASEANPQVGSRNDGLLKHVGSQPRHAMPRLTCPNSCILNPLMRVANIDLKPNLERSAFVVLQRLKPTLSNQTVDGADQGFKLRNDV
jgi:hypothetical protein